MNQREHLRNADAEVPRVPAPSHDSFAYVAPERPLLVKLLTAWHVFAFLLLGFLLSLPGIGPILANVLETSQAATMVLVAGLAGTLLAGSVGLWRGRSWGWWLACAFYAFSIVDSAITLPYLSSLPGLSDSRRVFLSVRLAGRAIWTAALLVMLFRPPVLRWCDLPSDRRFVRSLKVAGLGLLLVGFKAALIIFGGSPPPVE